MKNFLAMIAALTLGACTYHAQIPAIDGSAISVPGARQPGKYAALVETGGWDMNTKDTTFACSAHKFDADLNGPWVGAMKGSLTNGLENVDFVPSLLPQKELKAKGYDAQIGLVQSNGLSQVEFAPGFFIGTATSVTKLDAILTIAYAAGGQQQESVEGQGTASGNAFTCGDAEPVIGQSSAEAVTDLAQKVATTVKLLLAQHKTN